MSGPLTSDPAPQAAPREPDTARYMAQALALAARARGRTAPNPMVGAVIVQSGRVIAEGWHRAPGAAHAEVDALRAVGGRAPGATMYVNLEPCCHHGRTPPCTDALLRSGVQRVVVGMVDPDERMRGRGIEILREAGIEVEVGLGGADCRALNVAYLRAKELHRPFVTLKAAATLDGRIASAAGESRWITGPEAREAGHRLRDQNDAVLVGTGTLLADDPSLNTRISGGRDALPVLLDRDLRVPPSARVFGAGRRPLIVCGEGAIDPALPADLLRVRAGPGGLDLDELMRGLLARGVHNLLVEGGGAVHRSFLSAGLVDRVHLFLSPKLLVGGPGWLGGPPFALAEAPRLRFIDLHRRGDDLELVLEP